MFSALNRQNKRISFVRYWGDRRASWKMPSTSATYGLTGGCYLSCDRPPVVRSAYPQLPYRESDGPL
jgi:hypothetical protein